MTDIARSAKLSECGRYRYALTRTWDAAAGEVLFVMLNPSTADGLRDDPTIRKCIGFARRWGMGGIRVANLFAYRTSRPRELRLAQKRGVDIVGPQNLEHVLALTHAARTCLMAWGANAQTWTPYAQQLINRVRNAALMSGPLLCLGSCKSGHPLHPLTLPYSTPLQNLKDVT